jgi:hypothetical protein
MTTEFNFLTGDTVALSVKGAKGFCYPNFDKPIRLDENCCGLPMAWMSYQGFSAVSVPVSAVSSNFTPEENKPYVVVWVSDKLMTERQHGLD